jgi:DNA polymerase-3 subunit delta
LLYILVGPDDYSLQARLRELRTEGDDPSALSMNTSRFDGSKLAFEELTQACNTLPFLGQKRLVIVEGLLGRFEKTSKRQSEWKEWQPLANFVTEIPTTTTLILADSQVIRQTNQLLKTLSPKATVQSFPLLKGYKVQEWIRARVTERGAQISRGATELLAEYSGDDLWILANEIDKLALHSAGQTIQEEDVRCLTSYLREANVFAMVDAVMEHRADTATRLIRQMLAQGETVPYILSMITRQFRLIARANDLTSHGTKASELPGRLGVSPNYPLGKLLRQGADYSPGQLLQIFRKLVETDAAIKTGRYRDELALDLLVAELCYQPR